MKNSQFSASSIAKKGAGEAAAMLIEPGMKVGLGTGSTAAYFIHALGKRCQEGLSIVAAATSEASASLARDLGIPLISSDEVTQLDITVDGADEIDHHKNMIKGGGGALLKEKILAKSSREMIVIVDESKYVNTLGRFPLPVEISAFAYQTTLMRLLQKGYQGKIRMNQEGGIFITDTGHYIFDIQMNRPIYYPRNEEMKLKSIAGVLETGLFYQVAGRLIIGYHNGSVKIIDQE